MGGAVRKQVSLERKCPDGFDKDQFASILRYYDKLDSDGNNVLTQKEYLNLAQLYTKGILENITIKSKSLQTAYDLKKQRLSNDMKFQIKQVEHYYSQKLQELDAVHHDREYEYNKLIQHYKNMRDEQKVKMLHSTLGDKIDFWEFFQLVQNIDLQTIKFKTINQDYIYDCDHSSDDSSDLHHIVDQD